MTMFWIGLFIGVSLGVLAMVFILNGKNDECADCKTYYAGIIRDKEAEIHGLKSTKGKLGQELQAMAFRNAGFKAR